MLDSRGQRRPGPAEVSRRIVIFEQQRSPDAGASHNRTGHLTSSPAPTHPDPLVLPALAAHAPPHICGVRAVLEVVAAVVVKAASSAADHSLSVLVSPHT